MWYLSQLCLHTHLKIAFLRGRGGGQSGQYREWIRDNKVCGFPCNPKQAEAHLDKCSCKWKSRARSAGGRCCLPAYETSDTTDAPGQCHTAPGYLSRVTAIHSHRRKHLNWSLTAEGPHLLFTETAHITCLC